MTRDDGFMLLRTLGDHVQLFSRFAHPGTLPERAWLPAAKVYDAIRNATEPPITEEEFNLFFTRARLEKEKDR